VQVARKERIAVHGDYDVDGVTSTVILRRVLEVIGADVVHFIPSACATATGLQPASVERLRAEGAHLVVSVDCGIRGVEAGPAAREVGLDLIITGSPRTRHELPKALAVVNPKRHDCRYPDKNLAGVGVALKLGAAPVRAHEPHQPAAGVLKMAAIGTLADVVPLVGENRIIAKLGLDLLSRGPHRVGLRALLDVCGLTGKAIGGYQIGFVVAPRINAAGRMSSSDIAARLLLANDESMGDEARALAEALDGENTKRQLEEAEIVAQAKKIVETDIDIGSRTVPRCRRGWLASGRHRDRRLEAGGRLPSAGHRVVGRRGRRARVVPQHPVLQSAGRPRVGGRRAPDLRRAQAGGWGQPGDRTHQGVRARINAHADTCLGPDDLRPRLWIDGPLRFRAITGQVMAELANLAPFGASNPSPVFAASSVEVVDGPAEGEGAPPQDGVPPGREGHARHGLARGRA
jgi:single-stranded-DNA-specific exonuclease